VDLSREASAKLRSLLGYLHQKGLLIDSNWIESLDLEQEYKSALYRQLNFLLDVLGTPEEVESVQTTVRDAKLAIFGVGGVGSWLLLELLQMGFQNFLIIDPKLISSTTTDRHALPLVDGFHNEGPERKIDYYRNVAKSINAASTVEVVDTKLTTKTYLNTLLKDATFIINSADEPYIGYTSIRLSRYCVSKNIPLLVVGGFDAHLASMSELIIPHKTPCSDCYNSYFQESLKDWKPIKHVVQDRSKGIGGLKSLSQYAASSAALKVLNFYISHKKISEQTGGRGEFKFSDYSLDNFTVERDKNCMVCGD
jgi:molybdopterin/thiamine biosynthesis adenylyltransferase